MSNRNKKKKKKKTVYYPTKGYISLICSEMFIWILKKIKMKSKDIQHGCPMDC